MIIGEAACLAAYFFMKYVANRADPDEYDKTSRPVTSFIMLPVILFLFYASKLSDFL